MNIIPIIITTLRLILLEEDTYESYSAKATITTPHNPHLMMRVEYIPEPPQIIRPRRVSEVNP